MKSRRDSPIATLCKNRKSRFAIFRFAPNVHGYPYANTRTEIGNICTEIPARSLSRTIEINICELLGASNVPGKLNPASWCFEVILQGGFMKCCCQLLLTKSANRFSGVLFSADIIFFAQIHGPQSKVHRRGQVSHRVWARQKILRVAASQNRRRGLPGFSDV